MAVRYRARNVWYVTKTRPLREVWASENVRQQGALVYLPRIGPREPLFPGYLFVGTTGQWRFLRGTFGVMDVVMFGESPATISTADIASIRAMEGPDGFVRLPDWRVGQKLPRVGDEIELRSGLFYGSWGLFDGMDGPDRVYILLELLGRRTRVSVPLPDLSSPVRGRRRR